MVLQLIELFPTFRGTPHFLTMLTTACDMSIVHSILTYSLTIHFHIFLTSMPRSSELSLSRRFSHNNPACITFVSATVSSSIAWVSIS